MRFVVKILLIGLVTVATAATAAAREVYSLDDGWKFYYRYENTSDAARPVTLPHTWNLDALNGTLVYRRTAADYLRDLYIPAEWQGRRLFLRFYGVQNVADVFINGGHAGEHRGGFTAFTLEITDKVRYDYNNSLHVMVSNNPQNDIFPLSTELNVYGGIYRSVELIVTDRTVIDPDYFGTDGVLVNQHSVNRDTAECSVSVWLSSPDAQSCNLKVSVKAPDGYTVASRTVKAKIDGKPVTIPFTIQNPALWSLYEPNLYTVEAVAAADTVVVRTGFRSVEVTPAERFRLNGRSVPVRGVTLHHDNKASGSALTAEDFRADLALVRDMGANAVRSSTAPHAQEFYDLCDEQGVLVWVDFPLTQAPFPSDVAYIPSERLRENGRRQVREIIAQNYNHPSVVMWGVFSNMNDSKNDLGDYLREINDIAKRLDASRPTVACSNRDGDINFITDLIVWQQSFGWEKGEISDLEIWRSLLSKNWNHLKQAVIYGPHSASGLSESETAARIRERRNMSYEARLQHFHEGYMHYLEDDDLFWGIWLSQMFDYGSARYLTGIHDGGMVTVDRSHRKDLYYLYRSVWNSSSPTLHINTDLRSDPAAKSCCVDIYSSAENPLMTVGGDTVKLVRTDRTMYRSEELTPSGESRVRVSAGESRDSIVLRAGNLLKHRTMTAPRRTADR